MFGADHILGARLFHCLIKKLSGHLTIDEPFPILSENRHATADEIDQWNALNRSLRL